MKNETSKLWEIISKLQWDIANLQMENYSQKIETQFKLDKLEARILELEETKCLTN
jgi:aminopeptidase-like protein